MSRDLVLFLEDIKTSCSKVVRFTAGRTRDEVLVDELRFDAIVRNIHIIGEAVKNLPSEWRQKYPDVPWREIAGLRDFVAHAYFALDLDILWNAIQEEVQRCFGVSRRFLKKSVVKIKLVVEEALQVLLPGSPERTSGRLVPEVRELIAKRRAG